MEQPIVKVSAIQVFESEKFIRENGEECRKRTAYALADELLRRGDIHFELSEQVWLCGCMAGEQCSHGTEAVAMRATVLLKAPDVSEAEVVIYRFGKNGVVRIPKRESA
jgi:hypothetical protein